MDQGRWYNGQYFNLRSLKLGDPSLCPTKTDVIEFGNQWKYAVTVGVKIAKSAVKRNRVKRQAREVLRLVSKNWPDILGFYGLFVAKPGVLDVEYINIEQDIIQLIKKAGWV